MTETVNQCRDCGGKGCMNVYRFWHDEQWVQGHIPAWDEARFRAKWTGAVNVGVIPCGCLTARRDSLVVDKLKVSGLTKFCKLPAHREHCSFEWFDALPIDGRAHKEEARELAGRMAALEEIGRTGLLLHGDTGQGKSGLAAAVFKALVALGVRCVWIDLNEFLDEVYEAQQRSFDRERGNEDGPSNPFEFIKWIAEAPFLVFDDFGDVARKKEVTDFQRDKIYTVIRTRYEKELPSIITTNLSGKQLYDQFGKRIADRIGESWLWQTMGGASLRFGE